MSGLTTEIAMLAAFMLGALALGWILSRAGLYLISAEKSELAMLVGKQEAGAGIQRKRYRLIFRLGDGGELTCPVCRRIWQALPEAGGEEVHGILTHRGSQFCRFVFHATVVE